MSLIIIITLLNQLGLTFSEDALMMERYRLRLGQQLQQPNGLKCPVVRLYDLDGAEIQEVDSTKVVPVCRDGIIGAQCMGRRWSQFPNQSVFETKHTDGACTSYSHIEHRGAHRVRVLLT